MDGIDENLNKIFWLFILLITFFIMNLVSYWINGFKLDAVNQWIKIILTTIMQAAIISILLHWQDFR